MFKYGYFTHRSKFLQEVGIFFSLNQTSFFGNFRDLMFPHFQFQVCNGSMTEARTFSIQREVQLRFLTPEDIPEVKKLCAEWFPIEYVYSYFFSLCAYKCHTPYKCWFFFLIHYHSLLNHVLWHVNVIEPKYEFQCCSQEGIKKIGRYCNGQALDSSNHFFLLNLLNTSFEMFMLR